MAMRTSSAALSPKLKINTHPKNTVKWLPGTPGFWKPHYGASKMKWQFTLPYERKFDSLHHFPEISRITGKPIDWYAQEPDDGYEGLRNFGENTLELTGMPLGRTPEYMQERLRRFFSKFGPLKSCRAEPHSHDPYQCDGKAWVTFRDKQAALRALRAPLKFPASLHDKVVAMKSLDTDKRNDPDYYEKSKFWNKQLLSVARQLHAQLSTDATFRSNGKTIRNIANGLSEQELIGLAPQVPMLGRGGIPQSKGLYGAPTRLISAGPAVTRRFGSWEEFLTEPPFDEMFTLARLAVGEQGDDAGSLVAADADAVAAKETELVVFPRISSTLQRARVLHRGRVMLQQKLHDELSVYWREGKVPLPEYTKRRITWWDHLPRLPWELQIMSRSRDRHKIFCEKNLYRQSLVRARNAIRKERRADFNVGRDKAIEEKKASLDRRKEHSKIAMNTANNSRLVGRSPGLVTRGEAPPLARGKDRVFFRKTTQ